MKFEFKPEDFNAWIYYHKEMNMTGAMADLANKRLQEWKIASGLELIEEQYRILKAENEELETIVASLTGNLPR